MRQPDYSPYVGMIGVGIFGAFLLAQLGASIATAIFGGFMLGLGIAAFFYWLKKPH